MRRQFLRLALDFFHNREDAEDAVQDTLLRLWRLRDALPAEGMEAYAVKVVKNVCMDQWRRGRKAPQSLEDIEEPVHADTPQRRLEIHETEARLTRLLLRLPERHRLLLRMRHEENIKTEEISRLTGIPAHSVSTMLSQAHKWMREAIENDTY